MAPGQGISPHVFCQVILTFIISFVSFKQVQILANPKPNTEHNADEMLKSKAPQYARKIFNFQNISSSTSSRVMYNLVPVSQTLVWRPDVRVVQVYEI